MLTRCAVISLAAAVFLIGGSIPRTESGGANKTCSLEMYGGDRAAYWACAAQYAHQTNWYPSPIAGLFSYQVWNGYDGFWQNGVVLETFTNLVHYTNMTSRRFLSVVKSSQRDIYSLQEAYGPEPSFDDMGWYGLSYTRIHEVLGYDGFLNVAEDIFNWCWKLGWDKQHSCAGGFWFDTSYASKQTITNVELLQLAGRLYRLTKKAEYKQKMEMIYHFVMNNSLINEKFLMTDSLQYNCTPADQYGPTYNNGAMIGALSEMYKIDKNPAHLELAYKLAIAIFETYGDQNGVLVEFCEPVCGNDALMFKGIFVRNVRYLMDELSDPAKIEFLRAWLNIQIDSNVKRNLCDADPINQCNISFKDGPSYFKHTGPVFGKHWHGPFGVGSPMQQSAAMDLFVSAILPETRCTGPFCGYDPQNPNPQPLTCDDYPCPEGQDCCEYSPYVTYTCCAPDQKCNTTSGICN